jgi:acyl-CoA synthetase (AMP-forming)/AMP-acid ligase II
VPKSVVVVDDLPRTPAGKVRKHMLRAEAAEPVLRLEKRA